MSVVGGNSIANTVSVTPGGVGVNQAANVAALDNVTDAATATAYSLGQQLAITAWNIVFALAIVIWAFGWAGGKLLVEQSYADAKVKVSEQKVPAGGEARGQARLAAAPAPACRGVTSASFAARGRRLMRASSRSASERSATGSAAASSTGRRLRV